MLLIFIIYFFLQVGGLCQVFSITPTLENITRNVYELAPSLWFDRPMESCQLIIALQVKSRYVLNRTKSFLNLQFWSFQHRPGCYEFYLVSNWATIFFSSNGKFFADYAKIWKDWSRSNKNKDRPIKRKQNIWQKM